MMNTAPATLTENEFLTREITTWGFEHVESMLERGFEPRLTTRGWTWVYVAQPTVVSPDAGFRLAA